MYKTTRDDLKIFAKYYKAMSAQLGLPDMTKFTVNGMHDSLISYSILNIDTFGSTVQLNKEWERKYTNQELHQAGEIEAIMIFLSKMMYYSKSTITFDIYTIAWQIQRIISIRGITMKPAAMQQPAVLPPAMQQPAIPAAMQQLFTMTFAANGLSREQHHKAGWTDQQLIENGLMGVYY